MTLYTNIFQWPVHGLKATCWLQKKTFKVVNIMALYTSICTGVRGGRGDYLVFSGITQGCRHGSLGCGRWMEGGRCVQLSCVTPPMRVSLYRQRLSLWQPPAGPGVTSLPAHWHLVLGAPNCNWCPNILLSTCSSVHVLLPLFYVTDCHVMWLCIFNDIFVWTQVVNKLQLLNPSTRNTHP